jgi:hypothetical protein
MTDLDLERMAQQAEEYFQPDAYDRVWSVALSPSEFKELVTRARAHEKHRLDIDVWQEIGRLKERLDCLEASR